MKILFYSTKSFEKNYLAAANHSDHELVFTEEVLSQETAHLAEGFEVISIFTADDASAVVINSLSSAGVKFIAIRAAGYDNVDLEAAGKHDIQVTNVPEYSPYAIAEHAVALILSLSRRIVIAHEQLKKQNFTLDNLVGFDLHNKTVGVIGTGRIGSVFAKIMHGFGCKILAYDLQKDEQLISRYDVRYAALQDVCRKSDIISLHLPLNKETKHLIAAPLLRLMKKGAMLINTARGAVVNTEDVYTFLANGHLGYYGMDVYEKEKGVFFFDHTWQKLDDAVLHQLMRMPNILVTPHQAFATKEALRNIASTTFDNIDAWLNYQRSGNELIVQESFIKQA
ncbi:MAG: 2-hydroxyacid dehydrogenase [Chitinophagaceae bacterium]|nr:MAG: 2-hydroxyacid dehydrogenase [Chitinophagaceae bacterium]